MNKVFVILEGSEVLTMDNYPYQSLNIHKIFVKEKDSIKEAETLFKLKVYSVFKEYFSDFDKSYFDNFDDFYNKCSKDIYINPNSNLHGFFISHILDYFNFGFEFDKNFEKPNYIVKVEQHYIS